MASVAAVYDIDRIICISLHFSRRPVRKAEEMIQLFVDFRLVSSDDFHLFYFFFRLLRTSRRAFGTKQQLN
jgi:hypothetical protein